MCRSYRTVGKCIAIDDVEPFVRFTAGGLIQVEKYGQWSYFSRNEALIQQFIEHLQQHL